MRLMSWLIFSDAYNYSYIISFPLTGIFEAYHVTEVCISAFCFFFSPCKVQESPSFVKTITLLGRRAIAHKMVYLWNKPCPYQFGGSMTHGSVLTFERRRAHWIKRDQYASRESKIFLPHFNQSIHFYYRWQQQKKYV